MIAFKIINTFVVSNLLFCNGQFDTDYIDYLKDEKNLFNYFKSMNSSAADDMDLPANATSIRENITDSFSCENRTYGYYADVDNDCQIFHVCYPKEQGEGRRNKTRMYKWSFICPDETVFNQEVMVCTYPRDSIACEDSPQYYDKNSEFGKIENDTNSIENDPNDREYRKNKVRRTYTHVKENKITTPSTAHGVNQNVVSAPSFADNINHGDLAQKIIDSFDVDYNEKKYDFGDANMEKPNSRLLNTGFRNMFGRKLRIT